MEEKQDYQVLLFYKYVFIDDPLAVKKWQEELCAKYGFTGRLIIAKEGINCTLEGKKTATEEYIVELQTDPRFQDIHFKRSIGTGAVFPWLSIKVRPEIVSLHLGTCDIDPNQLTGIHLAPEELHTWIKSNREFYIIDMRNAYEHKVGHFENSILPDLNNFRDLPKFVRSIAHLKNKTVLTVCTGGIRCEKASGYLLSQGFTDVYQLDGGIVSYMEKYPNENFLGKLYVFDQRVTMGFYTDDPKHTIIGVCEFCNTQSEHYINCSNDECHRHFITCENCISKKGGSVKCPGVCTISRYGKKVRSPFWNKILTIFK